jgi:hypothetical protein
MTLISIPPTLLVYLLSGQMKQKFVELAATFEMDPEGVAFHYPITGQISLAIAFAAGWTTFKA